MCLAIFTSLWVLAPPSYEASCSNSHPGGFVLLSSMLRTFLSGIYTAQMPFSTPSGFSSKAICRERALMSLPSGTPNLQAIFSHSPGISSSTGYYLKSFKNYLLVSLTSVALHHSLSSVWLWEYIYSISWFYWGWCTSWGSNPGPKHVKQMQNTATEAHTWPSSSYPLIYPSSPLHWFMEEHGHLFNLWVTTLKGMRVNSIE